MATLTAGSRLIYERKCASVSAAALDVERDLRDVFGRMAEASIRAADIIVERDVSLGGEETYVINVSVDRIAIRGGGSLGMVYGLYRLSQVFLGVDSMAFWKDLPPAPRSQIHVPEGEIPSEPSAFRYRGWFVNDEDLLTGWWTPQGRCDIDYPYYDKVVNAELIDKICESALRCGMNLIIPASFLDVMNEPEADLLRACVRRGLYVSQHHVEPLGVSHFGFEKYWRQRGHEATLSYRKDPERVSETWRDYAERWAELAGDRVVWQLGLRGRGDRPVWTHDPSIAREEAGAFISAAMDHQWRIVRETDARAEPPATTTLWMEGGELIASGQLRFPDGMTIVFADGHDGLMGPEFERTPRGSGRSYGLYWHPAVWPGPHLAQAVDPRKVKHVFNAVVQAGDTEYAIINVANVREHALGIEAACAAMREGVRFDPDAFLEKWAPPGFAKQYRRLFEAWASPGPWQVHTDGAISRQIVRRLLGGIVMGGNDQKPEASLRVDPDWPVQFRKQIGPAISRLEALSSCVETSDIPERWRTFINVNIIMQANLMRGIYELAMALLDATRSPKKLGEAAGIVERMIADRAVGEQGKWRHWYRGDEKVGLVDIQRKLKALVSALDDGVG